MATLVGCANAIAARPRRLFTRISNRTALNPAAACHGGGSQKPDTRSGLLFLVREIEEGTEVRIGQVAGWPTAEQYEAAAKRALERAEAIRNQEWFST